MPRKSKSPEASIAGPGHNSLDRDKLRNLVERIENLESERAELASDIRDVYAEAKAGGLDVLGGIVLDPCTEPDNPTGASTFYYPPQDGCVLTWDARTVWCNPPLWRGA
jgi:hypothetical protein